MKDHGHDRPVFGCEGCIANATVPVDAEGNALQAYRVRVEWTTSGEYVEWACSKQEAMDRAVEFCDSQDAFLRSPDFDARVYPVTETRPIRDDEWVSADVPFGYERYGEFKGRERAAVAAVRGVSA